MIVAPAYPLAPTEAQSATLKELVEVIEERHYASRRYDDGLSAQHFAAYIDALDPQRMFFRCCGYFGNFQNGAWNSITLAEAANLDPAFTIFDRYHQRLKERLESILASLPGHLSELRL